MNNIYLDSDTRAKIAEYTGQIADSMDYIMATVAERENDDDIFIIGWEGGLNGGWVARIIGTSFVSDKFEHWCDAINNLGEKVCAEFA